MRAHLTGNQVTLSEVRVASIMMLAQPLSAPHTRLVTSSTGPAMETQRTLIIYGLWMNTNEH